MNHEIVKLFYMNRQKMVLVDQRISEAVSEKRSRGAQTGAQSRKSSLSGRAIPDLIKGISGVSSHFISTFRKRAVKNYAGICHDDHEMRSGQKLRWFSQNHFQFEVKND